MRLTRLERAVVRATGETKAEIRRRGFSLADPFDTRFGQDADDVAPQVVDWDALEIERCALFPAT